MTTADPRICEPNWRKSSYSVANGGCVEVGTVSGMIVITDSAEPAPSTLCCSRQAWRLFVSSIRNDQSR